MAHIAGGCILLDEIHLEPIEGWAILVFGKTRADLLFTNAEAAKTRRLLDPTLSHCDVVRVKVTGRVVSRLE